MTIYYNLLVAQVDIIETRTVSIEVGDDMWPLYGELCALNHHDAVLVD